MNTYLADSEKDGIIFCHEFHAPSFKAAEAIATKMGWVLLGRSVGDSECPADTMAMIEKSIHKPTMH